ncbi:hypothetical protein HYPSUDRAFT_36351 [Hypholoma sublateritium FD-334 SS-4]|uniref:DUF6534 domain-containing protein n=1 Tax=Hypholoma sublateritium (strain FD-334 SS-4) TaxID=945553 RepID=A0A0D2PDL7_HYPSF|nr:hypothetical protein HYPSUDRAFT_36351 [Hypholoma sublateritium FD-334 SS-4]
MSSDPVVVLPHIDIRSTFGATLIGSFIATMLYGLTTLQTYLYYAYYPKDSRSTKALVAVIWILDTLHAAFMAYSVYYYLVISYFNPDLLGVGHWSLFTSVAFNTVIACIAQTFFLVRVHQLCSTKYRWWVTSLIGLLVLAHFAFGVETVTFMFIKKDLAKLSEISLIAATPFAIFAVLSDIMIAGALCYLLHGSRSGFKRTDTIISILIIYAINRCLLTSVVAVVEVIVYCTMPTSLWFLAIDFFIGKLYANSLLATLNSRVAIRAANATTVNSVHLSELEFNSSNATETKPQARDLVLDIGAGSSRRHTSFPSHTTGHTLEEGFIEGKS